jgi:hypothetical protein
MVIAEEVDMLDLIMPILALGMSGGMIGVALLIWCVVIVYGVHGLGGWIGPLVHGRVAASLGRGRGAAGGAGEG